MKKHKPIPWEEREQKSFVRWVRQVHPELKIHHSPNGGHRHILVAVSMKMMGTSRGFPDILIFCRRRKIAMAIELKARQPHSSPVSQEQKEWLALFSHFGFHACVCRGAKEASQAVSEVFGAPHESKEQH